MFCNSYRQLAGALWLSLYCMKYNRHVIGLLDHYAVAIVVEAIVGETTMMLRWRSRCQASDNGDHDGDRKSTRLNSSHSGQSRMPSSA